MKISEYDKIVMLCVDHRYEAEASRVRELVISKGGGELEVFVDGKGRLLPRFFYNQISPRPIASWRDGDGAYAHFVAFKRIVQQAKSEGVQNLLFLEDDVIFTDDFDSTLERANEQMRSLPAWDLLYYGANHTWHPTTELSENILKLHGSYCTHCVGIRRNMFDVILDIPPERVMDYMIGTRIHSSHNCYAIWESVALQKPGFSYLNNAPQDYSQLFKSKGTNHT